LLRDERRSAAIQITHNVSTTNTTVALNAHTQQHAVQ
jgi:hypothetical protein